MGFFLSLDILTCLLMSLCPRSFIYSLFALDELELLIVVGNTSFYTKGC